MTTTETEHRTLRVGDIMYSSWGYDQTNVDFYKVVRVTKASAWLQPIGSKGVEGTDGFMCRNVVPDPDRELSQDTEMHRVKYWRGMPQCSLTSYSSAWLWTDEKNARGTYSSWYA